MLLIDSVILLKAFVRSAEERKMRMLDLVDQIFHKKTKLVI